MKPLEDEIARTTGQKEMRSVLDLPVAKRPASLPNVLLDVFVNPAAIRANLSIILCGIITWVAEDAPHALVVHKDWRNGHHNFNNIME